MSDLRPREFEIFEDAVRQDVATVTLTHGGRVHDLIAAVPPAREGLVLPASRPTTDASGRIVVIVLDDCISTSGPLRGRGSSYKRCCVC